MAGQTKKHSLLEAVLNTLVGYSISVIAQALIFPFFGCNMPISKNMEIGLLFTAISIFRSYFLRRIFNWLQIRFYATIS